MAVVGKINKWALELPLCCIFCCFVVVKVLYWTVDLLLTQGARVCHQQHTHACARHSCQPVRVINGKLIVQQWFHPFDIEPYMSGVCTDSNPTLLATAIDVSLTDRVYVVSASADAVCSNGANTISVNVTRFSRPPDTTYAECSSSVTRFATVIPAEVLECPTGSSCDTQRFTCYDLEGCGYIPAAGVAVPANGTMCVVQNLLQHRPSEHFLLLTHTTLNHFSCVGSF